MRIVEKIPDNKKFQGYVAISNFTVSGERKQADRCKFHYNF
jgi:hypothetical protein